MSSCSVPIPFPDTEGDERWMSIHKRFLSECREKDPDVIFLGDCILETLETTETWNHYFAPMHCLNFSIRNDRTENVLWRVENGELDNVQPKILEEKIGVKVKITKLPSLRSSPFVLIGSRFQSHVCLLQTYLRFQIRKGYESMKSAEIPTKAPIFITTKGEWIVVLHVGTNNIENTPEEISDGVCEIVNQIRRKLPGTYIVLPTILPRGQLPNRLREKNSEVNRLIKEKCIGLNRVQTVCIDKGLIQSDGTISHHDMFDYKNLTNTGSKKVFEPVYDLLSQILNENEPEKDLTPSE